MTEKHLKSLIARLNRKGYNQLIHLRPLSATVDLANVWNKKPKQNDDISHSGEPYRFYFIKNEDGHYVATVLDMGQDLHWFVDYKYRGQGHLNKAMRQTILVHLFQDRKEQRITIDHDQIGNKNFNSSEKLALSLGFVKTEDTEYVLANNKYQTDTSIEGTNTPLTSERVEVLKKQLNYLGNSLLLIHSEVEIKYGKNDYAEELKELVNEIKSHTWRLEDFWCDNKL